jgi:hypothetical protein
MFKNYIKAGRYFSLFINKEIFLNRIKISKS